MHFLKMCKVCFLKKVFPFGKKKKKVFFGKTGHFPLFFFFFFFFNFGMLKWQSFISIFSQFF